MQNDLLRIIDANCNRISEGLRVLEDIARFVLNDETTSRQMKTIRHSIIIEVNKIGTGLLSNRNSDNDTGAGHESIDQKMNWSSIVAANAKRVEQGLRVIEELSKSVELNCTIDYMIFKNIRFSLYSLERVLISQLCRFDKAKLINGLYSIIDTSLLNNVNPIDAALSLIKGGSKIIQLRDKISSKRELLSLAQSIKEICIDHTILFIINDHADIALITKADGLHVGQEDIPVTIARKMLPIDSIFGCSVDTREQAEQAVADGADYIAVGSIFPTKTKNDINIVGIDKIIEIKKSCPVPVVAIGGINHANVKDVISSGADAVAIISAILNSDNIEAVTKSFIQKINSKNT
jgi:thiamine-phosphate pyrophosphorylase